MHLHMIDYFTQQRGKGSGQRTTWHFSLVSFPGPSMVCAHMCVLHLGSGNETTLLTGSLLKTRGGESLVTVERKAVNFWHVII